MPLPVIFSKTQLIIFHKASKEKGSADIILAAAAAAIASSINVLGYDIC